MLHYVALLVPFHTTLWTPQRAIVDDLCWWLSCPCQGSVNRLLSLVLVLHNRPPLPLLCSPMHCHQERRVSGVPVDGTGGDGLPKVAVKGLCPHIKFCSHDFRNELCFVPAYQPKGKKKGESHACDFLNPVLSEVKGTLFLNLSNICQILCLCCKLSFCICDWLCRPLICFLRLAGC